MTAGTRPLAIGAALPRVDGPEKVTGSARYAYEQPPPGHPYGEPVYVHPLQADIARGRVDAIDTERANAVEGVLAVLTHRSAARLADTGDRELAVLQSDRVAFRGQFIGAVLADTPETARHAAALVSVDYAQEPHDTELLADHPGLYAPEHVNPSFETDTDEGDVDKAMAAAMVKVDRTYTTPMEHNNPMEPHTTVAVWHTSDDEAPDDEASAGSVAGASPEAPVRLTLYASTQGAHSVRKTLAPMFGLVPDQLRVVSPHVGGGFGSKGMPHAHDVLAALCARAVPGRIVKLAVTRQQMFSLTGHRTPTIQRVRLGADVAGRLDAVAHEVVERTSTVKEFAEQTACGTRMMYAAPHRRTTHRLAALDVPVPSWMRAPGEAPGIFALEVAMDELAEAAGLDPIELRVRNDPSADPETGKPWSGRHLVRCLAEGARHFGWQHRNPAPGARREGDELVGLGVAASTYPYYAPQGSRARVRYDGEGHWNVAIGAADIGTGSRTVLTQIAADALECPAASVTVELGDTRLPMATVAGGSAGTAAWGATVVAAAHAFRAAHGERPQPGAEAHGGAEAHPDTKRFAVHSFGAQFAEVRVDADTGEIRVPRLLGVFSVGRIINPVTARSQFIGGMTMGLSMALHEHSVLDHRTGHVVNHDFAGYHIATHADALGIEAHWLDEDDPHTNPMGARGIGEIGIVGCPAAIVNAVHNATGLRVRDLPITPDKLLH
ncbi:xanthine dehydrogenase family protein molybdopterin-binding subunit [Streptomyces sp. N2-109]|uniref:Xanthine dehydrogenase family protein molybdopterin-binding subunit n=1 Tax=Streptomyces gossypii TaxID=2883101 RepID=A0ABT2JT32_9ACTN|nr:xanthine dehydrogenase family protein molybdopterin-binding subunit [Streptomyces gossypii]MCT2591023.1 xanthine dehydrogenase family protein molybdopterin-binding subunit [Streptomyces gossypii]